MDDPRLDRLREVIDTMRAQGKSRDEIMAFADKARAAIVAPERVAGYGRAAKAAENEDVSLGHEIASAVGNMGSTFLNALSLGGYGKARDAILDRVAPEAGRQVRKSEEEFRASPGGEFGGNLASGLGYVMPIGAPGAAAKAGTAAAEAVGGAARPILGALASGATAGGLMSGGQSAMQGNDLADVGTDALTGAAFGAGAGAVPAALGAAGTGAKRYLANPKSQLGRSVSTYRQAQAEGAYKRPEFKALPEGKEGFNQVADESARKITDANLGDLRAARDEYGKGLAQVIAERGGRPVGLSGVHDSLDALAAENTVNDIPADEQLNGALSKVRRMLTRDTGILDVEASKGGTPTTIKAQAGSLEDLLKTKKVVQDLAEFGQPVTADNRPYRVIYKTLAQEVENVAPEMKPINQRFGSTVSRLERANDILYGKDVPDVGNRASAERTAALRLGRAGDDTQAATGASRRQLDELRSLDPRYAEQIKNVEQKKAYEATRFGLPRLPNNIENVKYSLAHQQAGALGARIGMPLAGVMEQASPWAAVTNPILRGYLLDQQRQRELADKLLNGGRQ